MKFNVADLPAVQAQLERDVVDVQVDPEPLALQAPAQATYPAKRLVLANGRYHVVHTEKNLSEQ